MCISLNCCPKCDCCCGSNGSDNKSTFLSSSYRVRIYYAGLFFIAATLAFILRQFPDSLKKLASYSGCKDDQTCLSKSVVLRIGFATSVFSALLAILTAGRENPPIGSPRAALHLGLWIPKLVFYFLCLFLSIFFIDVSFYQGFGYVALIGAALFIIIQILILIDFSYSINETLVGYADSSEEGEKKWLGLILFISALLYAGFFSAIGLMYAYMTKSGCHVNNLMITITLILGIIVTVIGFQVENSSILVSGTVCFYCAYQCFSAISSQPSELKCTSISTDGGLIQVIIGFIFVVCSVAYATLNASNSNILKVNEDDDDEEDEEDGTTLGEAGEQVDETGKPLSQGPDYSFSWFHVAFLLGSLYITTLLIDWDIYGTTSPQFSANQSIASMWIKWVSMVITFFLYSWTLIAPKIFESREF